MRRLSAELGVTPMATYHHASGREELLDLVIDQSLGCSRPRGRATSSGAA